MSLTAIRARAEGFLAHGPDGVDPLARDVLALLAVVEALPRCDATWDGAWCSDRATKAAASGQCKFCDKHSDGGMGVADLPYAAALRLVLGTSRKAPDDATKFVLDPTHRCEVCHWPLADSVENGCVPGNCSYRGPK